MSPQRPSRNPATAPLGIAVLVLGLAVCSTLASEPSGAHDRAVEFVDRAQAAVVPIPEQARVLADLAWPDPGDPAHDAEVREVARTRLIEFGQHAIGAVHRVVRDEPRHSADALAAFIEIRAGYESGLPTNYLVVLDDALWFGSREARRLAMQELGSYGRAMNFLSIVDAAHEDPELVPVAIHTLGRLGNDRARFWLARQLQNDDPDLRASAAMALASIGGDALDPLESGTASEDPAFRELCVRALVPVAGPEQLTTLYEYLAAYEDRDEELAGMVRERALMLERAMDAWIDAESASGGD